MSPFTESSIIDVNDQGPGVSAQKLPRLFERGAHRSGKGEAAACSRREGTNQGLGLGLYIVRSVMELHGGSVSLVRNTQQGVTMRLTLVQPMGD
jgi:signal transduction histidine kinase